jgi:hypothetical protein
MKIKHGFFARIDERLARLAVIEKHYLHSASILSARLTGSMAPAG